MAGGKIISQVLILRRPPSPGNFVDEFNPLMDYEGLKSGGKTPNEALVTWKSWSPYIQAIDPMVQIASCPIVTFQPAAGVWQEVLASSLSTTVNSATP